MADAPTQAPHDRFCWRSLAAPALAGFLLAVLSGFAAVQAGRIRSRDQYLVRPGGHPDRHYYDSFVVTRGTGWDAVWYFRMWGIAGGPWRRVASAAEIDWPSCLSGGFVREGAYEHSVVVAGFPFRCLRADAARFVNKTPRALHTGIVLPPIDPRATRSVPGLQHTFPYRPLWAGLLANTLIYGLASYGLGRIPSTAVRIRRRRRGLCSRCGYDRVGLAEGAACPECGSALATTGT